MSLEPQHKLQKHISCPSEIMQAYASYQRLSSQRENWCLLKSGPVRRTLPHFACFRSSQWWQSSMSSVRVVGDEALACSFAQSGWTGLQIKLTVIFPQGRPQKDDGGVRTYLKMRLIEVHSHKSHKYWKQTCFFCLCVICICKLRKRQDVSWATSFGWVLVRASTRRLKTSAWLPQLSFFLATSAAVFPDEFIRSGSAPSAKSIATSSWSAISAALWRAYVELRIERFGTLTPLKPCLSKNFATL